MSHSSYSITQETIRQAYQALRANDRRLARQLATQAARLDPNLEDPWLILAALAGPQAAAGYLKRALQINPNSTRAIKGLEWANQKLQGAAPVPTIPPGESHNEITAPAAGTTQPVSLQKPAMVGGGAALAETSTLPETLPVAAVSPAPIPRRRFGLGWLVVLVTIVGLAGLAWLGWPMISAVFAQSPSAARPLGVLQKPSFTPTETATPTQTNTPTATFTATATQTPVPSATSMPTVTPLPSATPETSDTRVPPTRFPPTRVPATKAPASKATTVPTSLPATGKIPTDIKADQRWVDVDVTHQRAYAYQGSQVVRSFIVSTGIAIYPTLTGQYHIYVKYRAADMAGVGWYLPKVPYVMYYYLGYGLHGTYWHNNFGHPMSHGCVNFRTEDAAWLFDFTSVGTLVNVHK